jgi:glutamyl/glutaminyl-tRNA synthetase
MSDRCRYAPTPSGPAHPGTLLAGLLAWLDARGRGAPLLLRLEDVDPRRCTPEHVSGMRAALAWLGLDWDAELVQSGRRPEHEAALDRLAEAGLLYPCSCSRAEVRRAGLPAADGGSRYPGTCRGRALPEGGWRASPDSLRLRLPPGRISLADESGLDLSQDPGAEMGDPVVRRRDGVVAYHLAVVVDDAADGITRVVRGRDLAASTAIQRVLQDALALPTPVYRHHLLLLEQHGGKLAKLHGAVGWQELRQALSAEQTCGLLAGLAGLRPDATPTRPAALLDGFDWGSVATRDRVVAWTGDTLELRAAADGSLSPAAR